MLSQQRVINLLHDWSIWIGRDEFEIQKICGMGKGPSQILVDVAKHDDPDTVYNKSRADNLDQEAMMKIDYLIHNELTGKQRLIIIMRYHQRWKFVSKIAKKLGWSRPKYYRHHDEALKIIAERFNNVLIA